MRYIHLDNKGYTLMELLLVLALVGIIMIPIGSFLIMHVKTFHQSNQQMEVQYQAQIAMNELINKAIEAKKIVAVYDKNNNNVINSSQIHEISKIIFERNGDKLCIEHKTSQEGDRALYYGTGNWNSGQYSTAYANVVYANYIESLKIKPTDGTYSSCRGIEIIIQSKKGNAEITIKNQIYFRN
ncbi:prepilin-type N-terminal cleavage/methylation domain-containing protein [Thermotalea metallivorans]|uniref:Prepilin-type N-terminal cleavage/methylation domain-containing protein n=1 Tax=Thermotalea metallivorans TaxID=520762 RepID=A0A140L8B1_9FIRM|nr:prepilin-type N-terminal cleavage/methylation domain-containing protein [Thermotalea metallivorans]KXG76786.1 hypothetical protein AN619_07780 [Thermotalea metallivorans]